MVARSLNYKDISWKEFFIYDESSPSCLRWNINKGWGKNKVFKGKEAGHLNLGNRWVIGLNGKVYFVSIIVWLLFNKDLDNDKVIDHLDHDPSNNKITNLREVPQKINARNKVRQSNNTTGYTGVSFHKRDQAYSATYVIDGKVKIKFFYLKHGEDALDRAIAYRKNIEETILKVEMDYTETHGKDLNETVRN